MKAYFNLLCIISVASLLLVSCKQNEDPEVQKWKDGIEKKHDEIMPKMATINSLKRQINAHNHGDAGQLLADLSKAEEVMNNWMGKYQPDISGTLDQKKKYYDKEYQKITQMEGVFEDAIRNAKRYVKSHSHHH